jgi:hypothetical protein
MSRLEIPLPYRTLWTTGDVGVHAALAGSGDTIPNYCRELCMGSPEPRLKRYGKKVGPLTPGTLWTF